MQTTGSWNSKYKRNWGWDLLIHETQTKLEVGIVNSRGIEGEILEGEIYLSIKMKKTYSANHIYNENL